MMDDSSGDLWKLGNLVRSWRWLAIKDKRWLFVWRESKIHFLSRESAVRSPNAQLSKRPVVDPTVIFPKEGESFFPSIYPTHPIKEGKVVRTVATLDKKTWIDGSVDCSHATLTHAYKLDKWEKLLRKLGPVVQDKFRSMCMVDNV